MLFNIHPTTDDVIGQYWKFQSEGHSAVSTIEAITYAAISVSNYLRLRNPHCEKKGCSRCCCVENKNRDTPPPLLRHIDSTTTITTTTMMDEAVVIDGMGRCNCFTTCYTIHPDEQHYQDQDQQRDDNNSHYYPLLTLFYLQKYRVLSRIHGGGKIPRAIQCHGDGLGSWKELTDAIDDVK